MKPSSRLATIFLACIPDAPRASRDEALESALHAYWEAARKTWPGLDIGDADFVRYIAARAPQGKVPPTAHAGDLLLACACERGVPHAIEAFRRCYGAVIARVLSRRGAADDVADDVAQAVYERLFVAPPGASPKIAEYRGTGSLRRWVATAAATTLLMMRRAAGRRREEPEDAGVDLLTQADPELLYMKERYKSEMEEAIVKAIARLSDRERILLRLHFGEHMGIDQLGGVYRVSRATAARWLSAARESLVTRARDELRSRLQLSQSEWDSMVAFIRSDLDISIAQRLS